MQVSAFATGGITATGTPPREPHGSASWQSVLAGAIPTSSLPATPAPTPQGPEAPGGFPPILGVTARPDGNFHLEDLRARLPSALLEFDQKLRSALGVEGISAQPPFRLQAMPDGKVGLLPPGDPRAPRVAALMEKRPDLADAFRELSSGESMLRAGDEAVAFQRAYGKDPKEAVSRFGWLLSQYRNSHYPAFQLTVGPDRSLEAWEDGYTGTVM